MQGGIFPAPEPGIRHAARYPVSDLAAFAFRHLFGERSQALPCRFTGRARQDQPPRRDRARRTRRLGVQVEHILADQLGEAHARVPILPFKLNQDRRHHIPKQKHKVMNSLGALLRSWHEYGASLRRRGSLTVWFTDEAIEAWRAEPRTTRGGQPWYSPLTILTALTLRAVFRMALRQTEGLIGSVIGLLRLSLAMPDHSTLSRWAETLEVPRP